MSYLVLIIFFIACLRNAIKNPVLFMVIYLYGLFFLQFFVGKISFAATTYVKPVLLISLILSFLLNILYYRRSTLFKKETTFIFITFFSIFGYLTFLALFRGFDSFSYSNVYRRDMQSFLIFIFILNNVKRIEVKFFYKHLFILILLQVLIGFAMYYGGPAVFKFFSEEKVVDWQGQVRAVNNEQVLSYAKLIHGTLGRYNIYGNVMSMALICLTGYIIIKWREVRFKKAHVFLFFAITVYAVFLSGNRVSFVSLVIGVIFLAFLIGRRFGIIFMVSGLLLYSTLLLFLKQFAGGELNTVNFDNPVTRVLSVVDIFSSSGVNKNALDESTFGLSISLIPYISEHPLFGAGEYYAGGYGFIYRGSQNNTDAMLFFNLAEYGIVGLFMYIFIYIYILLLVKRYCEKRDYIIILGLFTLLIVQTVTDLGLFHEISSYLFFATAGLFIRDKVLKRRLSKTKL